jgi:hypothetical protein
LRGIKTAETGSVWQDDGKNFPIEQIESFDLQTRMIIIAFSWSRDQSIVQVTLGRFLGYLLIRLITVFDPAFCRVFFLPVFGLMASG